MDELTERDRQILAFEDRWRGAAPGGRAEAVRVALGLPMVRYVQLLNHLIDQPAALAAEPLLVKRLQRQRDRRLRARAAGLVSVG